MFERVNIYFFTSHYSNHAWHEFTPGKVTFLPYLDFTLFDNQTNLDIINESYNINLNLKSGVSINIIYTLLFFLAGNISFIKKDIKS